MKKISPRKYNMMVDILQKEVPNITENQIRWLGERNFQVSHVKDTLVTAHKLDENPLKLESILAQIERVHNVEASTDEDTQVTRRIQLPLPPMFGNEPTRQDEEPQAKAADNDRKLGVRGGVVVALALMALGMMIFLMANCLGDNNGTNAAAVEKPNELESRVEKLEEGMKVLVGEDSVINTIAASADQLKQRVGDLETNKVDKTDLDKKLKEKANQSDLDKVRKRLRRVEKKLDAHIKNGDTVQDSYPELEPVLEPAEPTESGNGTVTVKVPKGAKVSTRYSKSN